MRIVLFIKGGEMSNYRKFMMISCIPFWLIYLLMIFLRIKYLKAKNCISFNGVKKPKFTKGFSICLIVLAILGSYPITLDAILMDVQEKVVVVTGCNTDSKAGLIKNEIRTDNDGIFNNMFKIFKFDNGNMYTIRYVPRSRIILYSKKVN